MRTQRTFALHASGMMAKQYHCCSPNEKSKLLGSERWLTQRTYTSTNMSGKGSRARRVAATRQAYEDVYRLHGECQPTAPFDNARQNRIYAQQYSKYRRSYWHMERMHAELAEVYGYAGSPGIGVAREAATRSEQAAGFFPQTPCAKRTSFQV